MKNFINIHVFAAVSSDQEAFNVGKQLSKILVLFGEVKIFNVRRYWKIPEYFEFSIELRSHSLRLSKCKEITKALGTRWVETGGSYIWTASKNSEFAHPSVKWVNIELVELS